MGTCYREVVRIAPFVSRQILSRITQFEPSTCLAETFTGPGSTGWLEYRFLPYGSGCRLVQAEQIDFHGRLRPLRLLLEPPCNAG